MEADWWARGFAGLGIVLSALGLWLGHRKDKTRIVLKPIIKRGIGNTKPYSYLESLKVVNNSPFTVWLTEVGVVTTDGAKFTLYEPDPSSSAATRELLPIAARASLVFNSHERIVGLSTLNKLEPCYVETGDAKRFTEPLLKTRFRFKREVVPRAPD